MRGHWPSTIQKLTTGITSGSRTTGTSSTVEVVCSDAFQLKVLVAVVAHLRVHLLEDGTAAGTLDRLPERTSLLVCLHPNRTLLLHLVVSGWGLGLEVYRNWSRLCERSDHCTRVHVVTCSFWRVIGWDDVFQIHELDLIAVRGADGGVAL